MEPEKIILELDSTRVASGASGLTALVNQLKAIEQHALKVNAALQGMSGGGAARSFKEIEAAVRQVQGATKGIGVSELAKGLDMDQQAFERYLVRHKASLSAYRATRKEFENARGAALAVSGFERSQAAIVRESGLTLGKLLQPTVQQVQGTPSPSPMSGSVSGPVSLLIPASQVQASVIGMVTLNIPGGQVQGGAAAGRNPTTGQFLPGSGGGSGGRGKAAAGKGDLNLPGHPGELERVRVETAESLRETITQATALGETVATTYDSIEMEIKKVTRTTPGKALLQKIQNQKALLAEGFRGGKAMVARGDYGGLAKLQESQAKALESILTDELKAALGDKKYGGVAEKIQAQANTLRSQASSNRRRGLQEQVNENYGARQVEEQARAASRQKSLQEFYAAKARRDAYLQRQREKVEDHESNVHAGQQKVMNQARREAGQPPEEAKPGKFAQALQSFSPAGLALNTIKVAGWAAAVTILYKSIELVNYSLQRMIEIGGQTARLQQIFKGVGGSAQQLTQDTVELASALGRTTGEAMEASIAWSRLGYTRVQVNEATRVSLMGANVAQIEAGQATRYLSSMTATYGLQASELNGVLGMLTNTANTYNVTVADLFDGISKVAPVAKQAGVSLAELQGIIGASVGRTGQTGANIGNALKSIMVSMSNPDNQSYMRNALGVETLGGKEGEMKSFSQVLRELYVRYQGLTDEERKNLTVRIAGRTQASRFVAILDSYITSQKLAADGQLNLNAAQSENAKIMATQKAQLAGLSAAWDSFVVKQGNAGSGLLGGKSINQALTGGFRTVKNLINLGNFRVGDAKAAENPDQYLDREMKGNWVKRATTVGKIAAKSLSPFGAIGNQNTPDLTDLFNHWMEGNQGQEERDMTRRSEEEERARKGAAGHGRLGQLYRTVASSLPQGRPEENEGKVHGLLSGEQGKQLEQLVAANNLIGAQALLWEAAAAEEKKAAEEAGRAVEINRAAVQRLTELRDGAQAAANAQAEDSEARAEGLKKVLEYEEAIAALKGRSKQVNADEDELSGDYDARTQKVVDLLERQKTLIETMGQLYQQMPGDTFTVKLEQQLSLLQQQAKALDDEIDQLEKMPRTPAVEAAERQAKDQRRSVRGELNATGSPENRERTYALDDRRVAFKRAGIEAEGMGVGRVEAEKMLNREAGLQKELAGLQKKKSQGSLSDNDRARQLQFEVELMRTQEGIQERILFLRAQQKQIVFDTNREFSKSLLFSSPGDLLKKMAVMQLSKNGMNAGGFFAMDEQNRKTFDDLRGGDAGRQNRLEQSLLRGRFQTVAQQQVEQARGSGRVTAAQNELGMPRVGLAGHAAANPMLANAKVAGEVAALGTASSITAKKVGDLGDAVKSLAERIASLAPSGKGLDSGKVMTRGGINTGHALGSTGATGTW